MVPDQIRRYSASDIDAQRVKRVPDRWTETFAGREASHRGLAAHSIEAGGIAPSFTHARSTRHIPAQKKVAGTDADLLTK